MPAVFVGLAHRVVLSWGWRRALVAFSAGALTTLTLAPVGAWPVLALTLPVLVWLLDGASGPRRRSIVAAFLVGWWFGFGYFLASLYWIGFAFLVEASTFGWLLPFAVTAMPAGLALFTGAGTALARLAWSDRPSRVLALAVGLTVTEWLRGHVLTGFPWNLFGYALASEPVLAQTASIVGVYGLTFLAFALFSTPALLADPGGRSRFVVPAVAALILAGLAGFGIWRMETTSVGTVPAVTFRVMQPNLPQDEKFNAAARDRILDLYERVSRSGTPGRTGLSGVTHLIWPESAFPFLLAREPAALARLAALIPPGTVLITGAARAEEPEPGRSRPRVYNSIYVIDHDGSLVGLYDKVHLVPFGEYLPFQEILEGFGLQQLTRVRGGFAAGTRRRALVAPGAPLFAPLICYEAVFPGAVLPDGARPAFMLNVTNDGWFGRTAGPHQHFQQARLRAIEEGLPMVRAANTGISAVIDPLGRITAMLPLGREGAFDASLPAALEPTWFARFRDTGLAVLLLVAIGLLYVDGRTRARRPRQEARRTKLW